jgi:hypothetical protein
MSLKKLIKEEVRALLKEYYHVTQDNRQVEVQEFLSSRVDREALQEFIKSPKKGRKYVREHHTERFYWWASEDIDNLFKNWK